MQSFTFIPYDIYFTDGLYNDVRRSTVINFGRDLMEIQTFREQSEKDIIDVLWKLEKGCYKTSIRRAKKSCIRASWDIPSFQRIYGERTYNLIQNLKSNESLLKKVMTREIDPIQAADLDPHEMCPELYADLVAIEMEMINVEIKQKANNLYTCKNCGTSGVRKENCYNRSFDESVTHRLTCVNCGNCWNE